MANLETQTIRIKLKKNHILSPQCKDETCTILKTTRNQLHKTDLNYAGGTAVDFTYGKERA